MAARPFVGVYSDNKTSKGSVALPQVLLAPIRSDIVQTVHLNLAKNKRQPYAVSKYAGHQHSAESWGTGRAVARIPRVSGGGTHRAGQGAFGNQCRKGRMFAPTKIWRRWHRKVNVTQKRHALVASLAATAVPSLLLARGHRVENIPEVPLVVDNKTIDTIDKTARATAFLKAVNAFDDVERVKESRHIRPGQGKARNRRYIQKRGPLVVYLQENAPMVKAFRNLPGVDLINVTRLNLLELAPGGHLGRFVIWTRDAFERLDSLYGTYKSGAQEKKGYHLPRPLLQNADLGRIINSSEVQSVLREKRPNLRTFRKKNPLKNKAIMHRLNPYERIRVRNEILFAQAQRKKKDQLLESKRKGLKTEVDKKTKEKLAVKKATKKFRKMIRKI
jgi:large subunit ribosomal protein L4e